MTVKGRLNKNGDFLITGEVYETRDRYIETSIQSEWQQGTLTNVVATDTDTLELEPVQTVEDVDDTQTEWEEGTLTGVETYNQNYLRLSKTAVGEARLVGNPSTYYTLILEATEYSNPIVFATVNATDGEDTKTAQTTNLTSTSVDVRVGEWENGTGIDSHDTRLIGVVVFDLDKINQYNYIEAGKTTVSSYDYTNGESISFSSSFDNTPVVIAHIQDHPGDTEVDVQVDNVTTSGFDIFLNSVDPNDFDSNYDYGPQGVAWFAVDPINFKTFAEVDAGTTDSDDDVYSTADFSITFDNNPAAVATVQTTGGSQRPVTANLGEPTTTSVQVRATEHDGGNTVDTHNTESTGWVAFTAGTSGYMEFYELQGTRTSPQFDISSIGGVESSQITYNTGMTYISVHSSSNLGWSAGGSGYNNTGGESDPCSGAVTFEQALQYAYDQGGRLPTLDEAMNNATLGTGCGYDNELIWTCDKGNDSSEHWVTGGDHEDGLYKDQKEIRSNTSTAYVRFVADNDLSRDDPVTLEDQVIQNFFGVPDGIVETRVSTDNGSTWTAWTSAASGDSIPDLSTNTDVTSGLVECRQTLSTNNNTQSCWMSDLVITINGRHLTGNRISPQIDLSLVGEIGNNSISWTETLNGETIEVQTRYSIDNGETWSNWETCTNGSPIPNLEGIAGFYGLLESKQILSTNNTDTTPQLNSLTLDIDTGTGPFRIDEDGNIRNIFLDETESMNVPMRLDKDTLLLNNHLKEFYDTYIETSTQADWESGTLTNVVTSSDTLELEPVQTVEDSDSTQSDFQQGTLEHVVATSSDTLELEPVQTIEDTDDTQSDWENGYLDGVTAVGDKLEISRPDDIIYFHDFYEMGGWTDTGDSTTTPTIDNGILVADGGEVWYYDGSVSISYDSTKLYEVSGRVRQVDESGNHSVYIGVEGLDSDGTTIINKNGADDHRYAYYAAADNYDLETSEEWKTFRGYFSGHSTTTNDPANDPTDPTTLYDGVTYIRPMFIVNHNSGTGEARIDYIKIREVSDTTNKALNKDVACTDQSETLLGRLTDGDRSTGNYVSVDGGQEAWVQIDMGTPTPINQIGVWHYYSDNRTYHSTKTQVAPHDMTLYDTPTDYADYSVWTIGTNGSQGDFRRNGNDSENAIIESYCPFGRFVPVWQCIPDSSSNSDGGWNLNFDSTSNAKLRLSVFVKRTGDQAGRTYFGCENSDHTLNLDGSTNGNPYFWLGDPPNLDEWYLMIGIIHPNSYTGSDTGESGLYDMSGSQVATGTDYKWASGETVQEMRAYLFYCTTTSVRQYFVYPRVDVIDGTEPTLTELLRDLSWETIFDSSNASEYEETSEGKWHGFETTKVRYIRDYLNGSTSNTGNHWVEIEAYGPDDEYESSGSRTISGADAIDISSTQYVASSEITYDTNFVGEILDFRDYDYINLGKGTLYLSDNHPFSITGWLYMRNFSNHREMLMCRHDEPHESSPYAWLFGFQATTLSIYDGSGWHNFTSNHVINKWYHVACSYDGSNVSMYLDGELLGTDSFTFSDSTDYYAVIGGYGTDHAANGYYKNVSFWKRPLSQSEVQDCMSDNLTGNKRGLIGHWLLNEGTGNIAYDYSDYNNHGIITGPYWRESTDLTVETRVSTDGGSTWTQWTSAGNGDSIPDLPINTDSSNALVEHRQSLFSNDAMITPHLNKLSLTVNGRNLTGSRLSPQFDISTIKRVGESNISWTENVSTQSIEDIDNTQITWEEGDLTDVEAYGDYLRISNTNVLDFDGINNYVDCGNDDAFNITKNFTLEAWVYSTDVSNLQGLITKLTDSSAKQYGLVISNSNIKLEYEYNGNNGGLNGNTTLSNNTWQHVAATVDSNLNITLYLNGSEDASGTAAAETNTTTQPLEFGRYGGTYSNYYLHGNLSEARIWNIVRSQTEIQDNMHKRLNGDESGLVAYYKLDEGTGTTATDSAGTNDGTINGATWVSSNIHFMNSDENNNRLSPQFDISYAGDNIESSQISWDSIDGYILNYNKDDKVEVSSQINISGELTVEYWLRPSRSSSYRILNANGYEETFPWHINSTRLQVDNRGEGGGQENINLSIPITENKWSHLAAVRESDDYVTIYINGLKANIDNKQWLDNLEVVNIGYKTTDTSWDGYEGQLSDVRLWNIARSQSEIQDNMYKQLNGDESGLVAYYKLDEGTGTTATDSAGTNDGTITGADWINTDITVETRVSTDGGSTWTSWTSANNRGKIPDLSSGTDVTNGLVECRQFLSTNHASITPELYGLSLSVYYSGIPADIETRVSLDNGSTWTQWTPASNGNSISDLPVGIDVSNGLVECRQIFNVDNAFDITASIKTLELSAAGRPITGNRISPQIDLSETLIINSTDISWNETLNGQSIDVETRISIDNGSTWSDWKSCSNGGAIPDMPDGTDGSNALIETKQILSTDDGITTPELHDLTININK